MNFSPDSVPETLIPSVNEDKRVLVDTRTAAHHLLRSEQTLRGWACFENGPIRPIRIGRRLGWPMAKIRELLKAEVSE
jgi:hypothetical protein